MKLFLQIFALTFGMILFSASTSLAQSEGRSGGSAPVVNPNNSGNRSAGTTSKNTTQRKLPDAARKQESAQAVRKGSMNVKKN